MLEMSQYLGIDKSKEWNNNQMSSSIYKKMGGGRAAVPPPPPKQRPYKPPPPPPKSYIGPPGPTGPMGMNAISPTDNIVDVLKDMTGVMEKLIARVEAIERRIATPCANCDNPALVDDYLCAEHRREIEC